ncbi:hypothetical protein [Commensalibacter communis]|nr:hypothetical protein [Commensalibacter communis]CAI3925802.1 unnamed protein product [Commensalibacter communis]CAI3928886.1 unnamed protein product [Commensalibacter communis]
MTDAEDIELSCIMIEDQDFIANARQDIPKLLQEIKLSRPKLFSSK